MIRVGNASGFYGDRFSAVREMLEGGELDYLTGDYLAELTMAILWRQRQRGAGGYVSTFIKQLEQVLATCLQKKIKIVANAGVDTPTAFHKQSMADFRAIFDTLAIA